MQPMWASLRSQELLIGLVGQAGYCIVEALVSCRLRSDQYFSWRLRLFLDMPFKDLTPNKTSHSLTFQTDRYGRQANVPRFQDS